jgi:hypothetical protein
VRCRPGIVTNAALRTAPDHRRITSLAVRAAPRSGNIHLGLTVLSGTKLVAGTAIFMAGLDTASRVYPTCSS